MAEGAVLSLTTKVLDELGSYTAGKMRSTWLADKDLRKIERSLDTIRPFIWDAENRQSSDVTIKEWVNKLKHVVYRIDDLLDEATTDALPLELKQSSEVRNYFSYIKHKVVSPSSLSNKIQDISDRLDVIKSDASDLQLKMNLPAKLDIAPSSNHRITHLLPFINKPGSIKGRDEDKREILNRVVKNTKDFDDCYGLSILPVVGISGLGKTTLAQLVYSDPTIEKEFDIKLWGCVSDPFKINLVLKRLLECVDIVGLSPGQMRIRLGNKLRDKRYFMVLDDVWTKNENEWDSLMEILRCSGAKGGVILVTTRDRVVARNVFGAKDPYCLAELPLDLCMSLFLENAFGTKGEQEKYPRLVEIGEDIVKKCGGLPLAAKTLGSSLRGQREEREWRRVAESNLWDMEQDKGGILPALKLSYKALDPELKSCLAYLSVFPKDDLLCASSVIHMWIAQDLIKHDETKGDELEDVGRKYLEELVSRSLLEEQPISFHNPVLQCKMHGLVHDLAMDVMREELALVSFNSPPVSRLVRHLVWDVGEEDSYGSKELPRGSIDQAEEQTRTFRFSYWMGWISETFIEQIILTFKGLRVFDLQCSELENIPESIGRLKHLRYLNLSFNRCVKELPITICKLLNLQTLLLMGCHRLQELPRDLGRLINLRFLALTVQSQYLFPKGMMELRNLPCLRTLHVLDCNELISLFPEEDEELLAKNKFLKRLCVLHVLKCPKLSYLLPKSLVYLTALKELQISGCESLDWRVEFPAEHGTEPNGLQSLELFAISGVPKLVGLPGALEAAASSLRYVCIGNCGALASLPDWMKNCTSLAGLVLSNCPNLAYTLPRELHNPLHDLYIEGCPYLSLGS